LIIFIGGLNKLKIMKITEKITITNEDCMDLLRRTPDKFYQLAIIDPPYGLDLANMNMGIGKTKKASKAKNRKWKPKDWDKETPTAEYFTELFRVSKNQIIWGGNYFDLPPCKNYIIWDKEIPEGLSFADCEMAWTSFDKAPKIFRYSAYLNKSEKFHPTQKPPQLYKYCLDKYAKQGDKILDTHLGSGSIAIACHDYGFELTACELDVDYYNKAIERIKNHISQIKLEL
jgi:site-specific DNA-methyltransferase (adenine-specific)